VYHFVDLVTNESSSAIINIWVRTEPAQNQSPTRSGSGAIVV